MMSRSASIETFGYRSVRISALAANWASTSAGESSDRIASDPAPMPSGWAVADGQGVVEDLAEALLAAGADRIAAGAQGEEHGVLAEFGQAQQARLGLGDQGIHGLLRELAEDLRLHAQPVAAVVEPFDIAHGDERLQHAVDAGLGPAADRGQLGQARALAALTCDETDEVEQRQRALDALGAGAGLERIDGMGDVERGGPAQEPTPHLDAMLLAEVLIRIGAVVHASIMARDGHAPIQDVEHAYRCPAAPGAELGLDSSRLRSPGTPATGRARDPAA
jgi:hypothetical protein